MKLYPLTPTLSHGGERENEVKIDLINSASQMTQRKFLRGYHRWTYKRSIRQLTASGGSWGGGGTGRIHSVRRGRGSHPPPRK